MAPRGLAALVLLASLTVPASAARQGLSDDEVNLESQIGALDDDRSSAARQEGLQVQNSSLTGPTTDQIRKASATAGFANNVYSAFALGGSVATVPSVGNTIISAGLKLWVGQMRLQMLRVGLCAEFMWNGDFGRQMQRVWDDVIVPALARASSAGGCNACAPQGAACATGEMKNGDCEQIATIAEHWLLYMETFLHVLTYLTAHSDLCSRYISDIQTSWNDLAEATQLAYGSSHWVYDFWWSDFMNHPRLESRPSSMKGMREEMELGTTWNPFRSTSSLDRIINVAKKLRIYNAKGQVAAPECLPTSEEDREEFPLTRVVSQGAGGPAESGL